ncbi:phosphatidylcholine synthase [Fodinibius roseus]|uniref:Phosphatidylcholine synthase n=1 Tax=Fodinibius roseus TaxID=1194090 RepID=A0A1M5D7U8_9BACT|nr:CDP-alcohol phosphatidyltransferase family protein [Fodinibius roseus]SHF62742.1 phosphatidylcholine synthase [Fodinibius roseus]
MKKIAAYGVHLLTATGAALGLWALILTFEGAYQTALWALAGAALIDSIDGALARLVRTKEYAARFDGGLMDNIVDFLTWTVAPLFWIYAVMGLPFWVLLICATASVFGFSNTRAKTDDHFFLGFPSYWNIVVFYIFLLGLSTTTASIILLAFALTTFLPVKFVYPTRTSFLRRLTLLLGSIFVIQILALVYLFDRSPPLLIYGSFLFPFYYFGLSFYLNVKTIETSA